MKIRILTIIMVLALALTGCAAQAPAEEEVIAEQPAEETVVEQPAEETAAEPEKPSFRTLKLDYSGAGKEYAFTTQTLDGETVNSADIFSQAKVTMVNVWGSFCPPCLKEMPDLARIHADYAEADFQIIGLLQDVFALDSSTAQDAVEIVEATGANYLHLISSDEVIESVTRSIYAVPTTLFVDSEGKLLCSPVVGSNVYETWAAAIDELLAR